MSDVTAFPRGSTPVAAKEGGGEKSETKDKSRVSKDDFLFGKRKAADGDQHSGTQNDKSRKKRKKRRKGTGSGDDVTESGSPSTGSSLLPLGGGHVKIHKGNYTIEALSFPKLAKGTKLLGTVREIFDEYALISLPGLLTGYILNGNVSPATHTVFCFDGIVRLVSVPLFVLRRYRYRCH